MTSRRLALAAAAFGLIAIISAPTGAEQRGASAAPQLLVVRDVTVIDATGAPARRHQSIVARDGQIADIVAADGDTVRRIGDEARRQGVRIVALNPTLWIRCRSSTASSSSSCPGQN